VDDGVTSPIKLIGGDAEDHNIVLREGHTTGPRRFVKDGILHVAGVGVDVEIHRRVESQACVAFQSSQSL
jgi:hypothetical protein